MLQTIKETAQFIRAKVSDMPKTAIILGTGLGELVSHIEITEGVTLRATPSWRPSRNTLNARRPWATSGWLN